MHRIRWIEADLPGRLTTMPRPRGGDWLDDELRRFRDAGIDLIVSMFEPDEAERLDLLDEPERCAAAGIRFINHPIVDRGIPTDDGAIERAALEVLEAIRSGRSVAVHCFAGIGRSTTFAAAVLILAGINATDALDRIAAARGIEVPDTTEQVDWIINYWSRRCT